MSKEIKPTINCSMLNIAKNTTVGGETEKPRKYVVRKILVCA